MDNEGRIDLPKELDELSFSGSAKSARPPRPPVASRAAAAGGQQPPRKMKNLRPKPQGAGLRVRNCTFCGRTSSSTDPVIQDSYLLWAHMETDGVSVQGASCLWCNSVLRGRFKGWKQSELKDAVESQPDVRKKFDELVAFVIKESSAGNWTPLARNAAPRETLVQQNSMEETIKLKGYLLYPHADFVSEFKVEPENMGLRLSTIPLPDGSSVTGYKIEDHGRRPVPPNVHVIERAFKKSGMLQAVLDDSETAMEAEQVRENFRHHAATRFAGDKVVSGKELEAMIKAEADRAAAAGSNGAHGSSGAEASAAGSSGKRKAEAVEVDPEAMADAQMDFMEGLAVTSGSSAGAKSGAPRLAATPKSTADKLAAPAASASGASSSAAAAPRASTPRASKPTPSPSPPQEGKKGQKRKGLKSPSPDPERPGTLGRARSKMKAETPSADILDAMGPLMGAGVANDENEEQKEKSDAGSNVGSTATTTADSGKLSGKVSKKTAALFNSIKEEWTKSLDRFKNNDIKVDELTKLITP